MIIYPHFSIQNQIMQHATTYYNIRFQKDMQIDLEKKLLKCFIQDHKRVTHHTPHVTQMLIIQDFKECVP
jgi:hypothetical protein